MHVFLTLLVQERSYGDSVRERHSAGEYEAVLCKMKVNTCTVCEIGLFTEEDDGEIGVLAIYICHCSSVFCLL